MTLREYLELHDIHGEMLSLACAGYANTAAGTIDTLSAQGVIADEAAYSKDGDEDDYRLVGSYAPFVYAMSYGLKIQCNAVVQAITQASSSVEMKEKREGVTQIQYMNTSTHELHTVYAKAVIVTVPLPILQRKIIQFSPPLSPEKTAAIHRMKTSNGIKLFLRFDQPVWPSNFHGGTCADTVFPEMWVRQSAGVGALVHGVDIPVAEQQLVALAPIAEVWKSAGMTWATASEAVAPDGAGGSCSAGEEAWYVMVGFAMGERADAIVKLGEEQATVELCSLLERMFHMDASKHLLSAKLCSWADEPYIHGAYTGPALTEQPGDRAALAAPHGAVYFAGEAVAGADAVVDSPMTVHGAFRTGMLTAAQAAASFA